MNRKVSILRYVMTLLAVCLPMLIVSAQEIRVTSPDEVLEGEVFEVQYDILSSEPTQNMPNIIDDKDFDLVREPTISRSSPSRFWGNDYYVLRIVCAFKPKKAGQMRLPRVEMTFGKKKFTSERKVLSVRDLPDMGQVNCFVQASTTKASVNVGDTLTLTYKLYTTKEITRITGIHIPKTQDFYYQDLTPQRTTFSEETVDGVDYKVYIIRKLLIQSRRLGNHKLSEGSIEVEYTYPTGRTRSDSWGREYEEQLRETKSCTVEFIIVRVHDMISI